MDLSLNICHINTAKKPEAISTLIRNYSKCNNLIASINEPPYRKGTVIGLNNFKNIIGITKSDNRINAVTCINGANLSGCQLNQFTNLYCSASEITFSSLNFIFISLYMSPSMEISIPIDHLTNIINTYHNKPIIICSDTNARNVDWLDTETNQRGVTLNEFILNNDLLIANENNTSTFQHFGNGGTSLIDLVIVNQLMQKYIESCTVNNTFSSSSDHRYLDAVIKLTNVEAYEHSTTTRKYNTKNADWPSFTSDLSRDLAQLNPNVNSKQQADKFINEFYETVHRNCSQHFKRLRSNKMRNLNWFDAECTKAKKTLNKLFRKLVNSRSELDKQQNGINYQNHRLKYKKLIKGKKYDNFKLYLENLNKQNVYNSLKIAKASPKSPLKTIRKDDGSYTYDHNETIEHLFNSHFPNSITYQLNNKQHKSNLDDLQRKEIIFTNKFEVNHYIKSMNSNKSPGPDAITSEIIKRGIPAFEPVLINLFNSLLKIGYFPNRWKEGVACFIPKPSTNIDTAKGFRPITLLNVISKCFEKIIVERLTRYLYENNKMNSRQYGFVRQRSTVDAISNLLNHVNSNKSANKSTVLVALDVSSAFDSVPWNLIIDSLTKRKVPQYLINLISSYLKHRYIRTTNTFMPKRPLTQGCPQGSCLGPLLFNVVLDNLLSSKILDDVFYQAFADDQIIAFSSKKFSKTFLSKCGKIIDKLFKEGSKLSLKFNTAKTQVLAVDCKQRRSPALIKLKINDKIINSTETIKYLGLVLDNKLTFKQHIKQKIDKASSNLNILRRLTATNYGLSPVLSNLIYSTVIEPSLLYCSSLFAHRAELITISNKLRSLQRKCCLVINKSFPTARTTTTIWLSGQLPIDQKIKIEKMKRNIKLQTPDNCESERFWLSKTPIYHFRPIEVVDQVPPTADYEVYTDGSKNSDGVGCAYVIIDYNKFDQIIDLKRLSDNSSVYQAELIAIHKSIQRISDLDLNDKSIYIITDSLSSIYSINNCNRQYQLASMIRDNINLLQDKFKCEIYLNWTPSHSGVYYNDLADHLAKLSTSSTTEDIKLKTSLSRTINEIYNTAFSNWHSSLKTNVSNWSSHFIDIEDISKLTNQYTTKFITGHGLFNSYRKMVGLTTDSSCCLCAFPDDTPEHSLFECPAFYNLRTRTITALGINEPSDLYRLNKYNWNVFSYYCESFHRIKKVELFG